MYIQSITPSFTGKSVKITIPRAEKQNSCRPLLYNEVMGVLEKNPFPTIIRNRGINISIADATYQAKAMERLENSLKKLGLYFNKIEE